MEQATTPSADTQAPSDALTVADAFRRCAAMYPDKPGLRTQGGERSWTWSELDERVRSVAAGLDALGIRRGDSVAMLLPNIPECHIVDFAVLSIGAIPFTIYNTSSREQIEHKLDNADAKLVVTQEGFLDKVAAASANSPKVENVISIDGDGGDLTLEQLEANGTTDFDFDAAVDAIDPEDVVCLIYTSGTTGPPKGAMWAHRTVMSQMRSLGAVIPLPRDNIISFLPMAHAGGRVTVHYMALPYGATITCCPDMTQLAVFLAEVHPDALFAVPRLWEKFQVAIEAMAEGLPDEQSAAAKAAIAEGLKSAEAGEPPPPIPGAVRPILERLGLDQIKAGFIGGAPSAPELSNFFRAIGVPMLEAYGSTECSLCVFNQIENFKGGTAGLPLPDVELKLAEDQVGDYEEGRVSNRGEMLIRGPLNMLGYRKEPDKTAETIDSEGWLHTGDIGTLDDDGFLTIVDRKKEIIISAAGKNMSPANIEQAIKAESSLIGQIVCIGDGKRYNTALITLDPEAAPMYAKRLGVEATELADIAEALEIVAEVQRAVDAGNERLARVETVRKFKILPDIWMPDSEILTPTAKVKRRGVNAKYAAEINELYAE